MEKGLCSSDEEKKRLRAHYGALRRNIGAAARREYSLALCARLRALPEFSAAGALAAFVAFGAEPDLSSLFPLKRLFLPRFNWRDGGYEMVEIKTENDLVPGKFGILEPRPELAAAEPDFVRSRLLFLVPAVACDLYGSRLGRGGGYYDRLLAGVETPAVGVIFSCQLTADPLPREDHDAEMAMVVTEKGVYRVGKTKIR